MRTIDSIKMWMERKSALSHTRTAPIPKQETFFPSFGPRFFLLLVFLLSVEVVNWVNAWWVGPTHFGVAARKRAVRAQLAAEIKFGNEQNEKWKMNGRDDQNKKLIIRTWAQRQMCVCHRWPVAGGKPEVEAQWINLFIFFLRCSSFLLLRSLLLECVNVWHRMWILWHLSLLVCWVSAGCRRLLHAYNPHVEFFAESTPSSTSCYFDAYHWYSRRWFMAF